MERKFALQNVPDYKEEAGDDNDDDKGFHAASILFEPATMLMTIVMQALMDAIDLKICKNLDSPGGRKGARVPLSSNYKPGPKVVGPHWLVQYCSNRT